MKRSLILLAALFPFLGLAVLLNVARLQASSPPSGGATFTVNSTVDATDVNPSDRGERDGRCNSNYPAS